MFYVFILCNEMVKCAFHDDWRINIFPKESKIIFAIENDRFDTDGEFSDPYEFEYLKEIESWISDILLEFE